MISGQANPAVNIVPVLDNGPYVVFAPTNDAFAAMEPGQLDAIKADPAALAKLDYYHVFLGLLGPDDVHGQRPTQQGEEVKVTGKGGDVKVNDTAKVVCGGIQASNARIYIIDTVLDPANPPEPITPSGTSSTTTRPRRPPRRRHRRPRRAISICRPRLRRKDFGRQSSSRSRQNVDLDGSDAGRQTPADRLEPTSAEPARALGRGR